jgi:hypothetical protein
MQKRHELYGFVERELRGLTQIPRIGMKIRIAGIQVVFENSKEKRCSCKSLYFFATNSTNNTKQ